MFFFLFSSLPQPPPPLRLALRTSFFFSLIVSPGYLRDWSFSQTKFCWLLSSVLYYALWCRNPLVELIWLPHGPLEMILHCYYFFLSIFFLAGFVTVDFLYGCLSCLLFCSFLVFPLLLWSSSHRTSAIFSLLADGRSCSFSFFVCWFSLIVRVMWCTTVVP